MLLQTAFTLATGCTRAKKALKCLDASAQLSAWHAVARSLVQRVAGIWPVPTAQEPHASHGSLHLLHRSGDQLPHAANGEALLAPDGGFGSPTLLPLLWDVAGALGLDPLDLLRDVSGPLSLDGFWLLWAPVNNIKME